MIPEFLKLPDRQLAYQRLNGTPGTPGVVFLGGYASDMTGTKAEFLAARCAEAGFSFLRFDYRGHGKSSGTFKEGTIGMWFDDTCVVFDRLTEGPQIVIGSSMGGWMALMLALKQPKRVKALVGIAAAPDFTEDLMWAQFSKEQRAQIEREGILFERDPPPDQSAPVTLNLIKEARNHRLLGKPIPITCPVRLLQGFNDVDVPWLYAQRIVDDITHDDVHLTLIKGGDHRLARPQDLDLLWHTVTSLMA